MQIETQDVPCPVCDSSDFQPVSRTRDFGYETCDNEFDYVRCLDCSQLYLRNRPLVSELATIYPANYLSNDYEAHLGGLIMRLRNFFQRGKIKVLRRNLAKGDLIVEIGPGAGDYLDLIRRFGDSTWEVMGVEFADLAVAALKQRGIRVIQARIEDLEWTERPAGAFVMIQLIEHVESARTLLRKCFKALRVGGVVVLETPNAKGWDAKCLPTRYWAGWHAPRHWAVFDPELIGRLATQEGFEVVEVQSTMAPYVTLQGLQYMMRDRWGLTRLARFSDVTHLLPLLGASLLDQCIMMFGGNTSNMQVVLRKP
jgi:SAM-dependent methyltransferase